ncbi:MAG: hypothetical protein IGR93_21145 [Hydrococcus sp. C42_A2020_068]|uniref:hypothetical protein n=1 Tax=Pleurocapsa sp. PCC 7327 TaxID=118163 RepID=UPI0002DC74C8|nr:hypothetical protein [Pleurocapsa sp. PCC 7327]MBF2022522.1 hypothetical protein [Hydrococcus sp. C42_A2020_068]
MVLVGIWKWLWDLPVEPGGKVAKEVAQESLKSISFMGANGEMKFLPTGDRMGKAILIQVRPSVSGYDFVPIQ